jgi:hypothetical protein
VNRFRSFHADWPWRRRIRSGTSPAYFALVAAKRAGQVDKNPLTVRRI